jgi:hypothetical protein
MECRAGYQTPALEDQRFIIIECHGCPACHRDHSAVQAEPSEHEVVAGQRKVEQLHDDKPLRSAMATLLESLRKATEAVEKLLKEAEGEVEETLPSAASLNENTELARLSKLTEEKFNIEEGEHNA